MLAKRIIPCLDVTAGRVVKGVIFGGLREAGDPVEIARRYNEQGADDLTFLDITASSDKRDIILDVIEKTAIVTDFINHIIWVFLSQLLHAVFDTCRRYFNGHIPYNAELVTAQN